MQKAKIDYSQVSIVAICTLAALFTALFLGFMPFSRELMGKRDFITYWATGQQLARHGNPYDPAALFRIEKAAGLRGDTPYFMRNVPWALPLAVPLGYVGARAATLPWSLAILGLLIASVRIVWKIVTESIEDPRRGEPTYLEWLGYCFPPALFCVILGQTSILLLFGLVLFLRFYRTRPFAAGAAMWFCSLKPHLVLPFVVVLLAWIVVSRSYRVLVGAVCAMLAGALLTELVAPGAFGQYLYYARTSVMTHEFTACLGDVLRDAINPGAEWLAFVPAMLGCLWALAYYWMRRHRWDWLEDGGMVVLVSVLVAPFGWIFDQTLAIPALLTGARRTRSRALLTVLAGMYLAVEIEVNRFELHSRAYLWSAPAWVLWYWLARRSARRSAAVVAESEALQITPESREQA